MPATYETLTLEEAKRMLAAAERKAASFGIAYNIAIVDAAGHLLAFLRQDGGLAGSVDLAINKAKTARMFDKTTAFLGELAQPGKPLFGIDQSNAGTVVIFGGGIRVRVGGRVRHATQRFKFEQVNAYLDRMRARRDNRACGHDAVSPEMSSSVGQ